VITRSISELCRADHLNDPVILGRWLANKTPEIVASWIVQPRNSVLVAVESGTILAVGSVTGMEIRMLIEQYGDAIRKPHRFRLATCRIFASPATGCAARGSIHRSDRCKASVTEFEILCECRIENATPVIQPILFC